MSVKPKVFISALLVLGVAMCDFSHLSASSISSTSRVAQRKAYRQGQAPSKSVQPKERLDLAKVDEIRYSVSNSGKNQTLNNTTGSPSGEGNDNKKISSEENRSLYAYQSNPRNPESQYLILNDPSRNYKNGNGYNLNNNQRPRYSGKWANRYASPNDAVDYQPNYNPVPQSDWDFQQNWQYYRKEYFSGETQPEVYRQHHPYGTGGIGYDPDPNYLRLQRMEQRAYNNRAPNRR